MDLESEPRRVAKDFRGFGGEDQDEVSCEEAVVRKEHTSIQEQVRAFLEAQPLYAKSTMELPRWYTELYPEVIFLPCWHCGETRPFRDYRSRGSGTGQPAPVLTTDIYRFMFTCTGCEKA